MLLQNVSHIMHTERYDPCDSATMFHYQLFFNSYVLPIVFAVGSAYQIYNYMTYTHYPYCLETWQCRANFRQTKVVVPFANAKHCGYCDLTAIPNFSTDSSMSWVALRIRDKAASNALSNSWCFDFVLNGVDIDFLGGWFACLVSWVTTRTGFFWVFDQYVALVWLSN